MPPPIDLPDIRPADGQNRGFNISAFRAHQDHVGILRNHDFHIEIPWPEALKKNQALDYTWRSLELACDSINFPATVAQTYKVQRYSYGAMEAKPTIPYFSDLQATFICDQSTNLWGFFHEWLRVAVNYEFDPNQLQAGTMATYEISYKPEYAVDMFLYIYDPYGTLVRKVGFREAWPMIVGDVQFAWNAGAQFVRVPVVFTFFDWRDEFFGQPGAQPQGLPIK